MKFYNKLKARTASFIKNGYFKSIRVMTASQHVPFKIYYLRQKPTPLNFTEFMTRELRKRKSTQLQIWNTDKGPIFFYTHDNRKHYQTLNTNAIKEFKMPDPCTFLLPLKQIHSLSGYRVE